MATSYETVLVAVTAETASVGAKVGILLAGVQTAVKDAYIARAAENIKPQGVKALDVVLAEIAASGAATTTALAAGL